MDRIIRIPDDNVVKEVLQFKVTGIRKRGGSKLRCADSAEDFGIMNEKTWRTKIYWTGQKSAHCGSHAAREFDTPDVKSERVTLRHPTTYD
ncbi:hypothetical protein TNCV_1899041 [Trichonephila clavipes]|nr:hypothetical protein TNCV_1899041 [Trichonephila clavipes]